MTSPSRHPLRPARRMSDSEIRGLARRYAAGAVVISLGVILLVLAGWPVAMLGLAAVSWLLPTGTFLAGRVNQALFDRLDRP